ESALDPAGPQAHHISFLWWAFLWVCVVVYVLVMIVLAGAYLHRRKGEAMAPGNDPIIHPDPHQERRIWTVVFGAITVTVITLFVLLIGDFATGRTIHGL